MIDDDTPVATGPVIDGLAEIVKAVNQLHNRLERPAPTMLDAQAGFVTHERLRVEWLVITVSAAGAFPLIVGTGTKITLEASGAATIVLPFPITIERGVDVIVTGAGLVDAIVLAYPE